MTKSSNIKAGKILLSQPFMQDSNFKRSAVLLCDHTPEGSVGFILNKPLNMRIDELIVDFPEFDAEVFFGGPVQTDTIHYVHDQGDILDNSIEVQNGVYWSGDFEKLKFLIDTKIIQPKNIRFFVGYSGWGEGQLKDEMEVGSWVLADMDSNYLFKKSPMELWQEIMTEKGDTYSVIAQLPDDLGLN